MELRRHQREALTAIADSRSNRHWVVLPPGAGKTLVGVATAAEGSDQVIAFAPNVAIVSQWRAAWESFTCQEATSDRSLPTRFTALTYQSLAVFDGESEAASARARLHPNGRRLVERLLGAGPVTLILDECHHLLDVWGGLLDEIISDLPQARVIALTATPPELLTSTQAQLVDRLFGPITYRAEIPALVAEGDLAAFAELAWFTSPTARETQWLDARAVRAAELITELTRVDVAEIPLISWVALHPFTDLPPEAADCVIRLARSGHLAMPEGAQPGERHRRDADLSDWLGIADGWLRALADGTPAERDFGRRVTGLLPGVGYRMTRHGIRPGQPLVDRVLARSASKAGAAVDIVTATLSENPEARLLVLTDHATATALPADLDGVLEPQSGSARWALEALAGDEAATSARPIMVTGTSIGARADVLRDLLPGEEIQGGDGVVVLEGSSSGEWLRAATEALTEGRTRCLIGTRGLLGEGWDARCVTGVVDLTSATTSTAIVQTRGRSLRSDPLVPSKVAVNWTVTCIADGRVDGDADYRRLVRKHEGWFAVDEEGDVADGVAHLDSLLSPEEAPREVALLNARALARAADPEAIQAAWDAVAPRRTHPVATLRVRGPRSPAAVAVPVTLPSRVERLRPVGFLGGAAALAGVAALAGGLASPPVLAILLVLAVLGIGDAGRLRGRNSQARRHRPSTADYARAVADALAATGSSPVGAEGVVVEVTAAGETRVRLEPGTAEQPLEESTTRLFADSLAEVLGPITQPRYLISRPIWDDHGPRLLDGLLPSRPDRLVWHQVPTELGRSRRSADLFSEAWARHVTAVAGASGAVFVGTPEGAGLLSALRFSSPFGDSAGISITRRRHW